MADEQPIGEVTQLIEKWLTLQSNGLHISVEELCQNSPTLISEVRHELSSIRKMDALLEEPGEFAAKKIGERTGQANCENTYVLQTLLGHGGCSEVYLAEDTKLGRQVAVKFLRPDTANISRLNQRLKQEAEITSQLNHPGIVSIHAAGEVDGMPFYSMQYVEGAPLSEAILNHHTADGDSRSAFLTFEMRKLLKHFVDVCQTIAFAHQKNIIHRDLKPANIVTGQFGETYVIDWGLARRVDDVADDESTPIPAVDVHDHDSRLTQHGHSLGTPAYMSPEQVTGQNAERPSDIFNLGATLYSILVGHAPYNSDSMVENLKNAQSATFTKPNIENKKVPAALSAICAKAMAEKPESRYSSAADLANEIECFLADQPITAMPTPLSDKLRRWLLKHRTAVTTLATTALVGLVLLGIGNSLLLNSNRKLTQSEATAKQRLYSQLIAVANSEIDKNNIFRAEEILEQCPSEFRQWEWRLLKNIVDQHKPLVALDLPGDQIRSLAIDKSGARIAAGDVSGSVRIWSVDSWAVLKDVDVRIGIRHIAFLPGTNKLIAGGTRRSRPEGRLSLVNISSGEIEKRIGVESQLVSALSITNDGRLLVTGEVSADSRGKIVIYDAATLEQIRFWDGAHEDQINSLVIDDDSQEITACGADGRITRWTIEGKQITSVQANNSSLLNIDKNSGLIATSGSDNIAQVWQTGSDSTELTAIHSFAGHTDQVLATSISPDQKFMATAGMDRDIHIWDLRSARLSESIKRHSSHVRCLKFHPSRPLLFSGGEDRVVNVWETSRLQSLKPNGLNVCFAAGDSDTLIVSDGKEISIWDAQRQKPIARINDHPSLIGGVAAGKNVVASFYFQGFCRLWNSGTGNLIGEFGSHRHKAIYAASIFDNDRKICLLHHANVIEIIDTENSEASFDLKTNNNPYRCATDGKIIAVGTRQGTLETFDLATKNRIGEIKISANSLLGVTISPTGNHVAVASSDGSITVWAVGSEIQICRMQSGSSWLNCISYTPDGKRIVSGNEHTLTCWDSETGQEIVSITMTRCVHEMAFNSDGTLLALASGKRDGVPKKTGPPEIKILRAGFQPGN